MSKEFDWSTAPTICEVNGFRWVLGPEAEERMYLHDATEWCEEVGGVLPPREILLLAWTQYFDDGCQDFNDKYGTAIGVLAVRAVKLNLGE